MEEIEPRLLVDIKIEAEGSQDSEGTPDSPSPEEEEEIQLETVKTETLESAPDEESNNKGAGKVDEGGEENSESNDLEYKVAHFLAETSCKRVSSGSGGCGTSGAVPPRGSKPIGKLKCTRCSAIFRYKSTLNYHMKSDCGTKIIIGKELVRKGSAKEAVVCDVCKKQLCSRTSLMVHMRIHTGERPFECGHCGRSFFQKAHLRDHVKSLHAPGRFLCRVCNLTFSERASLDTHLRQHFSSHLYQCQECCKEYTCKSSLAGHMSSVHKGSKGAGTKLSESSGYPCGACPLVLGERSALRRHRREEHNRTAQCQLCLASLSSLSVWRSHLRRAHHTQPFHCSACPRTFSSRYDLGVHLRSHTGERPYTCSSCGRSFARKSTLDVHTTLHTGRKDYVCTQCGQAFNRKSKLDVHMADHFNTTFQCDECHKSFKCRSYLVSHVKIHRGAARQRGGGGGAAPSGRHFACAPCSRSFVSSRALNRHLAQHQDK